jgi:hypothetical protein
MRYDAPPQFSPDGHWWWTGKRWVPVYQGSQPTWSQPAPSREQGAYEPAPGWEQGSVRARGSAAGPDRRRRSPAALWIAVIALLALVALALLPAATGWVAQQAPNLGPITMPGAPATPAPAPSATGGAPSVSGAGSGSVDGYRQMIDADIASFQAASDAVSRRCSPAALADDTAACRAALQSMDATVQRIQSNLDAQQVPGCLQAADREIRSALALYHQGLQQEIAGLDHGDPVAVIRGAGTLSDASGHVRAASSLLPASC